MTDKESNPTQAVARQLLEVLKSHYSEEALRELGLGTGGYIKPVMTALSREALSALKGEVPEVKSALVVLESMSGRGRGEELRRQALLMGLGDIEAGLAALIHAGLLVMLPEPGQRGWSLLESLSERRFLQRELLLPPLVIGHLSEELELNSGERGLGAISDADVSSLPKSTLESLELNLLHLSSALCRDSLLLNKDSSPNRRSVVRFVKGLMLPGGSTEVLDAATLSAFDFVLAIGASLGLMSVDEGEVSANLKGMRKFFEAGEAVRDKLLMRAYRSAELWNELEAQQLQQQREPQRSSGLVSVWSVKLGGPRGQVLSDLAKLPWSGWADAEAVVELLVALDRGYLAKSLASGGRSVEPAEFVHGMLTIALPWLGVVVCGRARGRLVLRLTERGRRLLRIDPRKKEEELIDRGPPFMVLPNFEVTVFLDAASLSDLFLLYQVSVRLTLSDRVAIFKLTAESVQRGYGGGLVADQICKFLSDNARVPVPSSVAFVLQDWERVHKKVTLFANGCLLQHSNPDMLDLKLGMLQHLWTHDSPITTLSSSQVFLPVVDLTGVARVFNLDRAHVFDYSAELTPSLRLVEEMTLAPLATGLDFVTRAELPRFTDTVGDPDWPDAWILNIEKIKAFWGDGAFEGLLAFLNVRLSGGVPAALELRLLALLGEDASASLQRDVTLLRTSTERVCDVLMEVPGVEGAVIERLSPTSLLIESRLAAEVEEELKQLQLNRSE